VSKKNTTHFTLDAHRPPRLTAKQKQRLDAMQDADIDYSDIPALGEAFWKNLALTRTTKKHATGIRLDEDVLNWFKKSGRGYQSHINAVLRAYVYTQPRH
jgi:uncharacterized protein (DUF4415 family)